MRDETGMTNHYGYRDDPARRIGGDLARLRRARMASRGACVSTRVATDEPTLLAARCGADTVLFDFSGDPASLPAAGNDRLTGEAGAGMFDGWQVAWIAGDVR